MKNAYLFGHTGSVNRGCEAIVRSTAAILEQAGFSKISLMVYNPEYDIKLGLDRRVQMLRYAKHSFAAKAVCGVAWRYFRLLFPEVLRAKADLKLSKTETTIFNIGGDTYCYEFPHKLVARNIAIHKKGLQNVFWGCSVEEDLLESKRLIADVNRYTHIVARESLSYEILKKALSDPDKLIFACDPAFHLSTAETPLPDSFRDGNTVGINLSPLVFRDYTDKRDIMWKNVRALMNHILTQTDMAVCLIPHVYDSQTNLQDIAVLRELAAEYTGSGRVSVIEEDLSCEQLKFIISRCRFFVGARTHTMIAAYSTAVPALALSYSIKSRGIARDLFGDESLVVRYKALQAENELLDAFEQLVAREEELRGIYRDTLTDYKNTICEAAEKIFKAASD